MTREMVTGQITRSGQLTAEIEGEIAALDRDMANLTTAIAQQIPALVAKLQAHTYERAKRERQLAEGRRLVEEEHSTASKRRCGSTSRTRSR